MDFRVFKIYPIRNSFDISIEEFVKYILREYNSDDITYTSKTKLDGTKIGNSIDNLEKPKYLYVRVNMMKKGNWTNSGGLEYAKIKLSDKYYISIRWDTHRTWGSNIDKIVEEFDIKIIRNKKLDKLEF